LEQAFGTIEVIEIPGVDANGNQTTVFRLRYTPFGNLTGEDSFRFTVADASGTRSLPQTVRISDNPAPIVRDDRAGTFRNEGVIINVVANDTDDTALDFNSIVVVQDPLRGQVNDLGNGSFLYTPAADFVGLDRFSYRISDDGGRQSAVAEATIRVVASRLQNPTDEVNNFTDVDDNGFITARDALLVINRLAQAGSNSVPVTSADSGPFFYDVNGDQTITSFDALLVINRLSQINNAFTNGEQIEDPTIVVAASIGADLPTQVSVGLTSPVDEAIEGFESGIADGASASSDAQPDGDVLFADTRDDDDYAATIDLIVTEATSSDQIAAIDDVLSTLR